jgi:hypothetical protein
MCEFISWIEVGKDIYFLTIDDLNSSKGRKLKKHLGSQYENDVKGHGAIEWFYDMPNKGTHKECIDFSTPDNFPNEIVKAIKESKFRGIGITFQLLSAAALAEHNKVTAPALAEYNKVTAAALAEYNKVTAAALAEHNKVTAAALAEYNKVTAPAWAEYNKVTAAAFWDLFANPDNRAKAWK